MSGELSAGRGKGENEVIGLGLISINGKNKIDSGKLGTAQDMEKSKNLHA